MLHQLTSTEARINNLTAYLTPILTVLADLNDAFCPPFVQPIIKTTEALIASVQLVESIHPVLFAILRIHLESETVEALPPAILEDLAEFMEYVGLGSSEGHPLKCLRNSTLHKTYTCIEMQQDGNKIRQFFRQSEAHGSLKECQNKLDQALMLNNAMQVQNEADAMHKELIDLNTFRWNNVR
ncbi:hypothetical protein B0H16DRAFT_1468797 [Mycena metata]|uniref:Uncharacterized protein n=1 Tax=Mycena metata TaxID=1033252 RepID=A0AAD7MV51_9AGAR|nr:hypothetical protein B0H16DRAFT_1468797 [Mycena metata]